MGINARTHVTSDPLCLNKLCKSERIQLSSDNLLSGAFAVSDIQDLNLNTPVYLYLIVRHPHLINHCMADSIEKRRHSS